MAGLQPAQDGVPLNDVQERWARGLRDDQRHAHHLAPAMHWKASSSLWNRWRDYL